MRGTRYVLLLVMLNAGAVAIPRPLGASASGPVPASTRGFGEMTCQQCHWDNPLNGPEGALALSGIPDTYVTGQRYSITVSVAHPALVNAGFQLSARLDSGASAGAFGALDERIETVSDEGTQVIYLQHTSAGTAPTALPSTHWAFEWTAPSARERVVFHAAANAANGDDSPLGDHIFTASATTQPK